MEEYERPAPILLPEPPLYPPQKKRIPQRFVIEAMRQWIEANPVGIRSSAMRQIVDRVDPMTP